MDVGVEVIPGEGATALKPSTPPVPGRPSTGYATSARLPQVTREVPLWDEVLERSWGPAKCERLSLGVSRAPGFVPHLCP